MSDSFFEHLEALVYREDILEIVSDRVDLVCVFASFVSDMHRIIPKQKWKTWHNHEFYGANSSRESYDRDNTTRESWMYWWESSCSSESFSMKSLERYSIYDNLDDLYSCSYDQWHQKCVDFYHVVFSQSVKISDILLFDIFDQSFTIHIGQYVDIFRSPLMSKGLDMRWDIEWYHVAIEMLVILCEKAINEQIIAW